MQEYLLATFSNFFVIIQSVDKKSLNPLSLNIIKKYAVTFFNEILGFAALCSQRVFQGGLLQDFLGTFDFWTFIFLSIFAERRHFFYGFFLGIHRKKINEGSPIVGWSLFSGILLSRSSLLLKIIMKVCAVVGLYYTPRTNIILVWDGEVPIAVIPFLFLVAIFICGEGGRLSVLIFL